MTNRQALGKLIVFEGPDGVGKSTIAEQLTTRLREAGVLCEYVAFPGRQQGSLGRLVYDLHHDAPRLGLDDVNATSLQLLHIAAHVDAIEGHILPALRTGSWIILDRFWWSTWVYGAALGVPERSLQAMIRLERIHWGQVKPAMLFLVERERGTPNSGDGAERQIVEGYRALADRAQLNSRVVTLRNDSSLANALDDVWDAISPISPPSVQQRTSAKVAELASHLRVSEDRVFRLPQVLRLSPARPTTVYDTYWRFAVERQKIFFDRIEGCSAPWTSDPILARYRFTNAYRASDRVSQYLIRRVIYEGVQSPEEVFFRTLLFKIFNKIETWQLLKDAVGEISYPSYSFDTYDRALTKARAAGRAIYSAAYIMPSAGRVFGYSRKHRNHLKLIERMMADEAPQRIADAPTMQDAFNTLRSYPTIGDFLAYQFVIDLNYSEVTNFSEMDFVVPGPGALDGIRKCFSDLGGLTEADLIRVVTERQEAEFERLGLRFRNLWGRRLQLVDCQNLFCEVSKYARIRHPEFKGRDNRSRIKQIYRPDMEPVRYWYPPKWRINDLLPRNPQAIAQPSASRIAERRILQ
ncbi:MAG: putative DNA base hypermodification protein [Caldilineaceae bacterium]|nr:putative DNA base hypermodification protein [Caldilineaceae bacterium]